MYTKLFAAFDAADEAHARALGAEREPPPPRDERERGAPGDARRAVAPISGAYPLERFGMTEIGVGMSNPLAGARRPGMVGLPLPTVETRIVDDGGEDAASGELWIRGPSVFSGYWKREEATAAAFALAAAASAGSRPATPSRATTDGYFRILGRTSVDILKSGGYKLSALEIEEVLREHASVAEVAVVGVPDETWGDRVVACVVPARRDTRATERRSARSRRSGSRPTRCRRRSSCMTELPRNAVGKVVKPELVKMLLASDAQVNASSTSDARSATRARASAKRRRAAHRLEERAVIEPHDVDQPERRSVLDRRQRPSLVADVREHFGLELAEEDRTPSHAAGHLPQRVSTIVSERLGDDVRRDDAAEPFDRRSQRDVRSGSPSPPASPSRRRARHSAIRARRNQRPLSSSSSRGVTV